ncbi:hypothetical protein ZIOFF_015891 [Zingiber officinale]|uniref:Uncharacterized protein n=1 Tax=Zingiber officinale TaxID=94328 RepID=A0A8J5I0Z2_ZINOF|nr:hypothetical protein ZIOFF_015891 [Zingiber officinale]
MSRVYVGNLDSKVTERVLEDEFRTFGVLRSVWVARRPPGYGFVEFDDRRDALDAIHDLDGKHGWRVELSRNSKGEGGGRDRRGQGSGGDMNCYECGEPGHFARECRLRIGSGGLGSGRRRSPSPPRYRRSPSYGRRYVSLCTISASLQVEAREGEDLLVVAAIHLGVGHQHVVEILLMLIEVKAHEGEDLLVAAIRGVDPQCIDKMVLLLIIEVLALRRTTVLHGQMVMKNLLMSRGTGNGAGAKAKFSRTMKLWILPLAGALSSALLAHGEPINHVLRLCVEFCQDIERPLRGLFFSTLSWHHCFSQSVSANLSISAKCYGIYAKLGLPISCFFAGVFTTMVQCGTDKPSTLMTLVSSKQNYNGVYFFNIALQPVSPKQHHSFDEQAMCHSLDEEAGSIETKGNRAGQEMADRRRNTTSLYDSSASLAGNFIPSSHFALGRNELAAAAAPGPTKPTFPVAVPPPADVWQLVVEEPPAAVDKLAEEYIRKVRKRMRAQQFYSGPPNVIALAPPPKYKVVAIE